MSLIDTMEVTEMIPVGGKKIICTCQYCRRDITQSCRIKCAVCKDFELCTDCFGAGVSLGSHENTHAYRVSDCLDFPIFTLDWSAGEELLLLEGMEKCGVGNWKGCSEYIGTKTSKQVEDHYWEAYMGVHGYCLPSTVISEDDKSTVIPMEDYLNDLANKDSIRYEKLKNCYETSVNEGYTRGEEVIRDAIVNYGKGRGGASSSASTKSGILVTGSGDASTSTSTTLVTTTTATEASAAASTSRREKDKQAEIKEKNALLPGGDLPGFLPLREDFDIEFDNDAEMLLADLEFNEDDHPTERELKHQVIQIFNRKIEERNRRKRFAIDRGLVDFKKHQEADRKRCKDDKELMSRLRMFARFQSAEDHEALVDGILRARKLRLQIQAFQAFRKLGITTLDQARKYEIERRKRENDIKYKKQRENESYLFQTGRKMDNTSSAYSSSLSAFSFLNTAANNEMDVSDKSNNNTTAVNSATSSSSTTAAATTASGNSSGSGANQRRILNRSQRQDNNNSNSNSLSSSNHDNSDITATNTTTADNNTTTNSFTTQNSSYSNSGNNNNNMTSSIMRQAPGAELLSPQELELCEVLPLLPYHYLAVKEAMIREAHRSGLLTLEGVKRMVRLDNDKQVKLYDFFVRDTSGGSNCDGNKSGGGADSNNMNDSGSSMIQQPSSQSSEDNISNNHNRSQLMRGTNSTTSTMSSTAAVAASNNENDSVTTSGTATAAARTTKNSVGRKRKTPRV